MGMRWPFVVLVLFCSVHIAAQDPAPKTSPPPTTTPAAKTTETSNTGESLMFLGKKLWFETRKRLNLATEEELKAESDQEAEDRKVKLKLGKFEVEK